MTEPFGSPSSGNASANSNSSAMEFPSDVTIGLTVFASVLFVLSMIGNVLVIHIVCTRKHMRTSTNVLILNMALGDLLLTIDIPFIVKWFFVHEKWFGGRWVGGFLCKAAMSAQPGSIAVSVFTLVFISLDRCCAILCPLKKAMKGSVLKISIIGIWLASVAFSAPVMIVTGVRETPNGVICNEYWTDYPMINPKAFISAYMVCTYLLPLVTVAALYAATAIKLWSRKLPGNENLLAQQKVNASSKKATAMLITVVVVFAVCWLPLQIREFLKLNAPDLEIPLRVDIVLPWIGISNIAINPLLYGIFSEKYRREFANILFCRVSQKHEMYPGFTTIPDRTPNTTPILDRRRRSTLYGNSLSPCPDHKRRSTSELIQLKDMNKKLFNGNR